MGHNLSSIYDQKECQVRIIMPDDIRDIWDWVRSGLVEVKLNSPDAPWVPEDMYTGLMTGSSVLLVASYDDTNVAFAIVSHNKQFEPEMFVWALWSDSQRLPPNWGVLWEQLKDFAREGGAKKITMTSQCGTEALWRRYGLTKTFTFYENRL